MEVNAEYKINIPRFIEETIIQALQSNNIFEGIMTVDEVREKLLEIVHSVEYEDMTSKMWDGYWQSRTNKLAMNERFQSGIDSHGLEVAIHELLHALSTRGFSKTGLRSNGRNRGLNEGLTEYLAQKLCPEPQYTCGGYSGISFNISGTYPLEQIMIKQLITLYGEENFIRAYLNNDTSGMMPEEFFVELSQNMDHIDELESNNRNIRQGRSWDELSLDENHRMIANIENIKNTFIASQQYFLEKCLMEEIKNISTEEQAREMAQKLRTLNSFNIQIKGNDKANYKKYNYAFIRKYLQIVNNKGRNYDEQIKFEEIEAYIEGRGELEERKRVELDRIESIELDERGKLGSVVSVELEKRGGEELEELNGNTDRTLIVQNDMKSKYIGVLLKIKMFFQRKNIRENDFIMLNDDRIRDYEKENGIANNMSGNNKGEKKLQENDFIMLNNNGEKMYIRKIGKELIGEVEVGCYELMTQEQYSQYQNGNENIQGEILRGNIDISRLQEDKKYLEYVAETVLSKDNLENRLLNYGGYIGDIENGLTTTYDSSVEERLGEIEKYIKLAIDGYDQDMYIVEVQSNEHEGKVKKYIILTREEVEARRTQGRQLNAGITILGDIDIERLQADKRYRKFIGEKFLSKVKIEERVEDFQGYVGEVREHFGAFNEFINPEYEEEYAVRGINGEEKVHKGKIHFYLVSGEKTGEKDPEGNDRYRYEFIDSDLMQEMREHPNKVEELEQKKIIIQASEEELRDILYDDIIERILYNNGVIDIGNPYSGNYYDGREGYFFGECDGNKFYMNNTLHSVHKSFATRVRIDFDIDIERMNHDEQYCEEVMTKLGLVEGRERPVISSDRGEDR